MSHGSVPSSAAALSVQMGHSGMNPVWQWSRTLSPCAGSVSTAAEPKNGANGSGV